ncbi:hypothetical protein CFter6_1954 [Collimonas fungivorans]|uniref:Uncharacterized protein n=1 Tax=Collimonas fungivorans TaxID=158899 RepID=A0A127PA69_9BURK|nr:hypothetical protein CFter6_1954 [Collimonas fungivorans]
MRSTIFIFHSQEFYFISQKMKVKLLNLNKIKILICLI